MKLSSRVKIDSSFANLVLQYCSNPSETLILQITKHIVAKKILSNAQISNLDPIDMKDFWIEILEREKDRGEEYMSEVKSCITYIKENIDTLYSFIDELYNYLPDGFDFNCTLYLHVGYDIGIVAEGDALLNVGHSIFHQNKRELLYFALHELHHVGYTHYLEAVSSLSEIQTTKDLVGLIERLTHLEGTATYAVKEIREREKQALFFDYEVLNNKEKRAESVIAYFEIYNQFKATESSSVEEDDFEILEVMAEEIDKKLGRTVLNQTIIEGSELFFEKYFSLL